MTRIGSAAAVVSALLLGSAAGVASGREDDASVIARIEGPQSPDRQGFDAFTVTQLMQRLHVPGASIAVIRDFQIHWAKGYGVADVETGRPVVADTLFQAASISKPVTAMAVLRLAQDGKLSLDGDVNSVLRSWHVLASALTRDGPVTLRSLMSHTSGADDGFGFPGYDPGAPLPTLVQILNGEKPSNVGPVLFARPPFAAQKYSGGGIVVVQLALTDLTGRSFASLMKETVLGPLGMSSSTYEQPPDDATAERTSRAHDGMGHSMGARWHVYPEQAAAGLWTTPSDLARFAIEVQVAYRGPAGRVLSQAAAREMIAPVGVGPFAVGLSIEKRGEGWYLSHSGGNWGFACDLLFPARTGYGVVVMTNSDRGFPLITELEARVAAAYGWDSLDKPLPR